MSHRLRYVLVWLTSSALLLSIGFLVSVYAASLLAGSGDPEAGSRVRLAFVVYAKVVLLKGLLPQLVLALALWLVLDRMFLLSRGGRAGIALGLVASSTLAGLAVATLLLPGPYLGLSVHYPGVANFLATCAELTAATALALAIPRLLLPPRAGGEIEPPAARVSNRVLFAGLAVVALAGVLLVLRDTEHPAPGEAAVASPLPGEIAPAPVPGLERAPTLSPSAGSPPSSLPVHLLKTQVEALASQSLAVVYDHEAGTTESLHEGDPFAHHRQARLTRIEADRVIVDNDGRLEELFLETPAELLAALGLPNEVSPEARERMRQLTQTLRDRIAAEREGRGAELNEDLRGGLLAEADPHPIYREGALQGFELQDLRSGGTFDRIGLRDGDVVTAVNGVPFRSLTGAEIVRQLTTSQVLEFSVERPDGTLESVSLPTSDLLQRLRAIETQP